MRTPKAGELIWFKAPVSVDHGRWRSSNRGAMAPTGKTVVLVGDIFHVLDVMELSSDYAGDRVHIFAHWLKGNSVVTIWHAHTPGWTFIDDK